MCAGCTDTVGTLDTVRTMGTVGLVGRKCALLHKHRHSWYSGLNVHWLNRHRYNGAAAAQRGNHFRVPPTTPTPSFSTKSCAQEEIEVFLVAFE